MSPTTTIDYQRGPEPIVVAVDDSASAREAVRWAAALAVDWDAPLSLVHVLNRPGGRTVVRPRFLVHLGELATSAGAQVSTDVNYGGLSDQLTLCARRARLLVLGSYGEGAWTGALAGGNALAMITAGVVPVVIVRGAHPGTPPPTDGPIVVGVDETPAADRALRFAAELAVRGRRHHLVLVHAASPDNRPDLSSDLSPDFSSENAAGNHDASAMNVQDADVAHNAVGHPRGPVLSLGESGAYGALLVKRRRDHLVQTYPELSVSTRVVAGTPLASLRALVDDHTWMVVVGHHRSEAPATAGDPTGRGLIESAPCPVAVIPALPSDAAASCESGTAHVADVMTTSVLTTTPRSRAVEAALTIAVHNIGSLPVLDQGHLVGIFTEESLTGRHDGARQQELTVATVMNKVPVTVSPHTPVEEVAAQMRTHNVDSVPVLHGDTLVGIVTRADISRLTSGVG